MITRLLTTVQKNLRLKHLKNEKRYGIMTDVVLHNM